MIRRTVTLPEALAAEIDALVAAGHASNVSRFMQEAARAHVDALRRRRVAHEARKLDPAEEVALASHETPSGPPPWGRLGGAGDPRGEDRGAG